MKYTREQLIADILEQTRTYETYPFNGGKSHEKTVWTVMKHNRSDKMTAMVFERLGKLFLSLKLTPAHVDEMTKIAGVERGFHMNKQHWVTISVNETALSESEIWNMLAESEALTEK